MKLTVSSFTAGDAFVRELDVSKITLRLREKLDKKGDQDSDNVIAKLQGDTIDVLQRCLVRLDYKLRSVINIDGF